MQKPHVILRTHSGVPTPPPWANWFRVYWRLEDGTCAGATDLEIPIARVAGTVWNVGHGYETPVVAVEWIA